MKPRTITMQAFGAYLEETGVDFTKLYENQLFLISGPTGSGKTSILDAMSFALYGHATGSVRDVRDMRNTAALKSTDTRVAFELEINGYIYVFERVIKIHERRLRAGGTEDEIQYDASCTRLNGQDMQLICSGTTQTSDKAQELLGFSYEQFSQIVVLPQGEFRRLLTASSAEKQKILETLFGTQRWQLFNKRLFDYVKMLESAMNNFRLKIETVLGSFGAADMQGFENALVEKQMQLAVIIGQLKEENALFALANSTYNAAVKTDEAFKELDFAQLQLEQLTAQAAEIETKRQRLGLARKALQVLPYFKAMLIAEAATKENACQLEATAKKNLSAELSAKQAQEQVKGLEYLREKIKNNTTTIVTLKAISGPAQSLAAARFELRNWQQTYRDSESTCKELQAAVEVQNVVVIKLEIEMRESFEKHISRLPELKAQTDELDRIVQILEKEKKLSAVCDALFEGVQKKRTEFAILKQEVEEKNLKKEQLEASIRSSAAVMLSRTLTEGSPCPVCGALHHPEPAKMLTGKENGEEQLKECKQDLLDLNERFDKIKDDGTTLRAQYDSEFAHLEELRLGLLQPREELQQRILGLTGLENELAAAQAAQGNRSKQEASLQVAKGRVIKAAAAYEVALQQFQSAAIKVSALNGRVQELTAAVPEEFTNIAALNERLKKLQIACENDNLKVQQIEQTSIIAGEALAGAEVAFSVARISSEKAQAGLNAAAQEYLTALENAGLRREVDIKDLLLDEKTTTAIGEEILLYQRKVYTISERIKTLEEVLLQTQRPDLTLLKQNFETHKSVLQSLATEKGAVEAASKALESAKLEAARLQIALANAQEKYSVYNYVSSLVGGENALKTPIHQFVLGLMLEDIIASANLHLSILSRGQYTLMRSGEPMRGGGTKGLELCVNDAWRGGQRSVSTLSGGEMFLASLSLAFGLSDVVQAYAGGIRLDSIFIDEGFGSLDSETLDTAMNALAFVRGSGRLVGIISHVGELRERIPARIEVTKSQDGSSSINIVTA